MNDNRKMDGSAQSNDVFAPVNDACASASAGKTEDAVHGRLTDEIIELRCNLDDMTPEAVGYAQERLWEAGAVDVFTMAIQMKKNRPGVLLTCLCRPKDRGAVIGCLFQHTTTLGVRETLCRRSILKRTFEKRETPFGTISVKKAEGYGVSREKYEYEELAAVCRKQGISIAALTAALLQNGTAEIAAASAETAQANAAAQAGTAAKAQVNAVEGGHRDAEK